MAYFQSKSQLACQFSVERMFLVYPKIYFWTFTYTQKMHDCCYGYSWHLFWLRIQHHMGDNIKGVRVFEPHKRGGMHVHLVCNRRINVNFVRKIGGLYGIGRVHVRRAVHNDAGYLSKYLTKSKGAHGVRKWARVGGYRGSQVRNIVCDGKQARALRMTLAQMPKLKKNGERYLQYQRVLHEIRQLDFYGELDERLKVLEAREKIIANATPV